ncbi:SRPBCC family protein [Microbulbifer sp. MLAF003]|uniref:SRPBCC family protein n=1 Tax=unclassified Microbulbifer TaxID=2619833 RepID=UPI0024AD633B|nr:SRPBCC family protein [Microbulbifer sp. MLAF003]WHI52493.1 SRPBCC family protein [Microbulbifer sp. MLAF003]
MRWIIYILIFLVLLLLAGYLFPREVSLERSVYIDKPPQAVFPYVNNFRKFNSWSPWRNIDPSMQYDYSGPEEGVGAEMSWRGENSKAGNGSQTITASTPNSMVRTKLAFGDGSTAEAEFKLQPEGEGTKITWAFMSDTGGGPRERWMGLAVKKMVGESYEHGLSKLKNLLESSTDAIEGPTPGGADQGSSNTTDSVSDIPSDVDDAMGGGPQGVQSEMQNQQQEEAGETPENEPQSP